MSTTNSPGTLCHVEGVGTVFTPAAKATTTTVTISIGRNTTPGGVHVVPLTANKWAGFRAGVSLALADASGNALGDLVVYVADAKSTGAWFGTPEESRTWVASATTFRLEYLRLRLERLARINGQDAIALTIGTTELVAP